MDIEFFLFIYLFLIIIILPATFGGQVNQNHLTVSVYVDHY